MKNRLDLDDLPGYASFAFVSVLQSAIFIKEEGFDKNHFMNFCRGCWETMEMNDLDFLKKNLEGYMQKEVKDAGYEKKNK